MRSNDQTTKKGNVLAALRANFDVLPTALSRIAKYILDNPEKVINQSIAELAAFSNGGQASVVRLCRVLNFRGYQEFKLTLAADLARFVAMQGPSNDKGWVASKLLVNTISALHAAHDSFEEETLSAAATKILKSHRVDIYGIGVSGLVAKILAYKLLRVGVAARACSDIAIARELADTLCDCDMVIAITESGLTLEIVQLLRNARLMGASTLAITNRANSVIAEIADVVLLSAYVESPLTGGTLTSTTTQLYVIECLAAAVGASAAALNSRPIESSLGGRTNKKGS